MIADSEFIVPGAAVREATVPRFFIKAWKNQHKSALEGRDIYEDREYVEVLTLGDNKCIPVFQVKDEHKARWPKQYQAFKNGLVYAPEGTPLEKWTLCGPAEVEHLKHFNIRTVEQLAAIGDNVLSNLGMGSRALREKAIVWLAQARDNSGISRVVAENDELKAQMAAMQKQMDDVVARVAAKQAEAPASVAAATPAPGLSAEAIQQMVAVATAQAVAAALAAQPPKNKGGRPKKDAGDTQPDMAE